MRQLATIQRIAAVEPIEGADKIEKVRVNDWWCVAKKGEFKEGDKCVYFEIDSLLPDNEIFGFLRKGSSLKSIVADGVTKTYIRLKTVRLRGQLSQGLALPEDVFRDQGFFTSVTKEVGDDVSEELGVLKYEPAIPAQLAGVMKGNFPSFVPKTDEERVQNIGSLLEEHQDTVFYVTEKLDGTSATFYKKDGEFGVCSRNIDLKESEGNTHWEVARSLGLPDKLNEGWAIQGEIMGEGIQKNPLNIKGHAFFAYNVYDTVAGEYLSYKDFRAFCKDLGVETVPVLNENFMLEGGVEELLAFADGKSSLNSSADREGVVIRPLTEQRVKMRGQEGKRLSFKVISNAYLLNGNE